MKFTLIIDKNREEEVSIVCHEKRDLFEQIERMVTNENLELTGIENDNIVLINVNEVSCFISSNNSVYALVGNHRYRIKKRLYQIEEMLDSNYIKINQSCIANIKQIKQFKASFNGFLEVIFKNGYKDYISRRELKNVKERIGL